MATGFPEWNVVSELTYKYFRTSNTGWGHGGKKKQLLRGVMEGCRLGDMPRQAGVEEITETGGSEE